MAVKIELKRSSVPGKIPELSQLDLGELAINTYDGKVFLKQDTGTFQNIIELASTSGSVVSASYASYAAMAGTASYAIFAQQAQSASYSLSSSFATSGSYAVNSSFAISASYAVSASHAPSSTTASYAISASHAETAETASSADQFQVRGLLTGSSATFSSNITASNALIQGTITAQTLVVQTISSSVIYSSGSNIFGDELTDVQQFTGSVNITGSLTVNGPATFNGSTTIGALTGSLFGTASWANNAINALTASTAPAYTLTSSFTAFTSSYYINSASFSASISELSSSFLAFSQSYNTGSLYGTASWAENAINAYTTSVAPAYTLTSSFTAFTSSYYTDSASFSASISQLSSSYTAFTASYYIASASFSSSISQLSSSFIAFSQSYNTGSFSGRFSGFFTGSFSGSIANIKGVPTYIPLFDTSNTIATSSIFQSGSFSVIINQTGNTSDAPEALYVWQPSTSSFNVISGKGNLNNYLQLNIQNTNQGTDASSDVVATANNGDENGNYVNMGINSENYSGFLGGPNDAYVFNTGSEFHIGNASLNKHLGFFVGGPDVLVDNKFQLNPNNEHSITGSLEISGSLTVKQGITGSLYGTASWAVSASHAPTSLSSSYAVSASYSQTASFAFTSVSSSYALSSSNSISSSYALTASFALNIPDTASFAISASYALSASNAISSSYAISSSNSVSSSYALSASYSQTSSFSVTTISASYALSSSNAISSSYALSSSIAVSASYAISSSNAISSSYALTSSNSVSSSYAISSSNSISSSYSVSSSNAVTASYSLTSTSASFSISSSYALSSSYAVSSSNAVSASYALSASYSETSSFSVNSISASYALTASHALTASSADNFLVRGNITASNALISNTLTAQTLVVQTVTSSIVYSSGSNIFGNQLSNTQQFTGSVSITGSLTVNGPSIFNGSVTANNLTGSLFGTASWALNAVTASHATTALSASYAISASNALSSSYAISSSNTVTASYALNAGLLDGTGSGVFATTGSNVFRGNQTVTGSLFTTGSNTLIGITVLTGSLNITGSTVQVGNNSLIGNTSLSGSLIISGSQGAATPTIQIFGDVNQTGYTRFLPVTTNIDTSISASYIYVSGSTQDLYFSQNSKGYNNVTRLRWLEGNLYTGLLNGGLITAATGSTTYQISSGSGIIVNLNASLNDNPYPTIQYLNWGNLTGSIVAFTSSFQQVFVGIDSTNNIFAQGTPFSNGQFDTVINVGGVFFQNGSTINAVKTQPSVAYGFEQQQNIFNRAFGPLKLSGYTLAPSGSSTGSLVVGSGTAYAPGSNYAIDPNEPSYTVDNGTNISKIFRYRQSGSTWVYDTNGGAGYTVIDPANYSNNGVLTTVQPNDWSIQRVFWFPNSVVKAIVVYYGNQSYSTEAEAIANINIESFVEAPNTAANAIYLGSIVIRGNGVLTVPADFTILPGGLFRQVGGSGGGGSVVTQTLAGLSDVSISGPTNLQPLAYSTTAGKWINTSTISASIAGNASTATSASFATTASFAVSSSYALSSSNALTSSYAFFAISSSYAATASRADNAVSASFAATASFIANVVYTTGSQSISGLKTFTDKTTFNNHVVLDGTGSNNYTLAFKQPSSTLSFLSGDYTEIGAFGNSQLVFNFGQLPSDYKRFTFNVANLSLNTPRTFQFPDKTGTLLINDITTGSVATASLALTSSYALNTVSASYAATASIATSASFALTAVSASFAVNATTASYALNAVSASFASTASFVLNAISASFATNASTASYVLNAVSASFASTASFVRNAQSASYVLNAVSASFASTASFVNTLNQNVLITGSLTVGATSAGATENTLIIGPAPAGGAGEGGQLLLQAQGGTYTSASMWDNWQNQTRLLRGTNAGSDAVIASFNMHSGQVVFSRYTGSGAFTGTATANLSVDSSGNVITTAIGSTLTGGATNYVARWASSTTLTTGSLFDNGTNVGVGNQSPSYKLDVTGDIRATSAIYANANGQMYFRGGDDAELWDINVANTLGVYGQQDQTVASIKLGSGGGTISGRSGNIGVGTINPNSASLHVSGNVFATSFTGSLLGTATTASYVLNAVSASFAATASSADNFLVRQNVTASNALITGTLTAQTLVVQTVTSSIIYSSGSNIFGNSLTDRQILTGSVSITGSLTVNGPSTFNGVVTANNLTGSLFGTASYAIQALSASYAVTGGLSISSSYALSSSYAVNASSGSNFVITNSYRFDATLNDYATVISSISGTNNLFTQPTGSFTAGFYKYTVTNGTNARTGEVMAVWNAGNVEFTDFSTVDLGNTLAVSASVTIVSAEAQLNIITNTSGWSIKALATYM